MANFIEEVNYNHESYSFMSSLTCRRDCFSEIQKAVKLCNDEPENKDCMSYLSCNCVDDLLSMFQTMPAGGIASFPQFNAALDKIDTAGTNCRCEGFHKRAAEVESSLSCALSREIVIAQDVFAATPSVLTEICIDANSITCAEDAIDVLNEINDIDCRPPDNADFLWTQDSFRFDFQEVANFACADNCYMMLKTCNTYAGSEMAGCLAELSCECKLQWLSFVENLSSEFSSDFIKAGAYMIDEIKKTAKKCSCVGLNSYAAALQSEGFCALQKYLVANEDITIFTGELIDYESTCLEPLSCVEEVKNTISEMTVWGCDIKQDTDESAMFLYNLNSSIELQAITSFICDDPTDGCYTEIKTVVEDCSGNETYACVEAASRNCLLAIIAMLARLTDYAKERYIGFDTPTLGIQDEVTVAGTSTDTETKPKNSSPLALCTSHDASWLLGWTLLSLYFSSFL